LITCHFSLSTIKTSTSRIWEGNTVIRNYEAIIYVFQARRIWIHFGKSAKACVLQIFTVSLTGWRNTWSGLCLYTIQLSFPCFLPMWLACPTHFNIAPHIGTWSLGCGGVQWSESKLAVAPHLYSNVFPFNSLPNSGWDLIKLFFSKL
jgi:hypothetical protein